MISKETLDEIEEVTGTPLPGSGLVQAEEVVDPHRAMVVVAVSRPGLHLDITYEWLVTNLYGGAQLQLEEAALIVTTDPAGRMACVLKNDAQAGELLTMHTASIG